jgi:signal transduction histidine kinase
MGDDEWPLLLRLLLEEPPDEREERATCIADSRIRSLAWRAVGSPAAGARTVTGAETILHDVIKHGFPQLEAAQRLARLRPLPRVECGPIHLFLDDLSQWLNGLEVAPRLLLDELELADALRQRAVWGRDESSELEELVSTVRRILEQLTAQLWVAVPAVVQHVVARHREQGVTVDVQCDPDRSGSMRVVAELHAVESLVGNLVMNAVQATRGAVRPKILIDLRLLPGAVRRNPLIEISVEDTGAGAACALRSSHGGMGLDIASRHLQAMQGSIEERASPLGGRAFVVRFPRLALPPEAPAPPPAPRPAITAPASPRSYEELVQRTRKSGGDE